VGKHPKGPRGGTCGNALDAYLLVKHPANKVTDKFFYSSRAMRYILRLYHKIDLPEIEITNKDLQNLYLSSVFSEKQESAVLEVLLRKLPKDTLPLLINEHEVVAKIIQRIL